MFRNIILLAVIACVTSEVNAQNTVDSLENLRGRWQEISRASHNGQRVTFTDTLQLNFNKRDSVVLRDGSGVSFEGAAGVFGRELEVAGITFTIESLSNNKLILSDSLHQRVLVSKKIFHHETLGRKILPKEDLSNPVKINTRRLKGNWHVYRTQTVPGVAHDSVYIRSVEITKTSAGQLSGLVTFQQGEKTSTEPFTSSQMGEGLQIKAVTHTWDVMFYKLSPKEIIFGNHGGLVYFAKPK